MFDKIKREMKKSLRLLKNRSIKSLIPLEPHEERCIEVMKDIQSKEEREKIYCILHKVRTDYFFKERMTFFDTKILHIDYLNSSPFRESELDEMCLNEVNEIITLNYIPTLDIEIFRVLHTLSMIKENILSNGKVGYEKYLFLVNNLFVRYCELMYIFVQDTSNEKIFSTLKYLMEEMVDTLNFLIKDVKKIKNVFEIESSKKLKNFHDSLIEDTKMIIKHSKKEREETKY